MNGYHVSYTTIVLNVTQTTFKIPIRNQQLKMYTIIFCKHLILLLCNKK